jgi:hypothetical protein
MAILQYPEDRKGLAGTILVHALIFILMLIVGFRSEQKIETDNGGVMVSFGEPDQGSGDDQPMASESEASSVPAESSPNEAIVTNPDEAAPEVVKADKPITKPVEKTIPNPVITPTPAPKPTIDPRLKAQLDKMKNPNKTPGGGIGKGPNPGDKGLPDGTGTNPEGGGTGNIGKGFKFDVSGFKVLNKPVINNEKQQFGKVVLKVCLDKQGKIRSISQDRGGINVTSYLYSLSEKAVRELVIVSESGVVNGDYSCGKVTVEYNAK